MAKDEDETGNSEELKDLKSQISRLENALSDERKKSQKAEKDLGILRTANATDKQKEEDLTARMAELEKKSQEAEVRALRLEIAAEKGLSAKQARRLTGTTREELVSDADEMIEEFGIGKKETKSEKKAEGADTSASNGKSDQGSSYFGRPKDGLKSGASNEDKSEKEPDISEVADKVMKSF